ncbi:MAG TPA: hypothetical protein VHH09_00045 [Acidimicrobiales bacterium]|nr:hypothetical protein [Acidimicrobiales bacterium]
MNLSAVSVARHFRLAGEVVAAEPFGAGHIHDSFLVTTGTEPLRSGHAGRPPGPRYLLQRLNQSIFPDPVRLAETVARVTAHQHRALARAGCPDPERRALTVVEAGDGRPFHVDEEGGHWRAFLHVAGARSHRRVGAPGLAAEVARVAARFLTEVADLPGGPPAEAIPGFRDFRARQATLEEVAADDPHGRRAGCGAELDAVRAAGSLVDELDAAREAGLLPERVVHHDAKADNVLVDEDTGEGLCMVDLDTVASGTVLFDVGDLVRSATTTVAEDDPDAPVEVRRDHLEAILSAYLATAGSLLTADERALLSLAGPLMTYEAALRFLTDHVAGDVYYRLSRPGRGRMSRALRVDAGPVARIYDVVDGRPRPVAVERNGVAVRGRCREPSLMVDAAPVSTADLVAVGEPRVEPGGTGGRWTLAHPSRDLQVGVVVAADRAAGVVRTHLEVTGRGRLDRVELDRWHGVATRGPRHTRPSGRANAGAPGLGQPLFHSGLFTGVEHPGAENLVVGDQAVCAVPHAVPLGTRLVVTPPVVTGAAPPGREHDAFLDYLDGIRAAPARLVALVNNWYQLGWPGTMAEDTVVAELAAFAAAAREHGAELDAYCLDDAWEGSWDPETGLWGRLDPGRFPGGLTALEAAAPPGTGIGLWVSPFGGYGERSSARIAWGRDQGYEIDPGVDGSGAAKLLGPRLCPAGNRYGAHLAAALGSWTAAGVRYWKLDGVQFDCQADDHGHAVGPGGVTDQMDRFAAAIDAARAADPGVAVAFTSGSNPSPWWLRHADFLWRGGVDDTAANLPGPRLQRFATYIDACLDEYRDTAVPVSALVTFSVVENGVVGYREPGQTPLDWHRHCWWMVGRGTLHHDLYVSPGSLSGSEWQAVARALRWARAHQAVLARSRMFGGHPMAGKVYGFVARRGADAVVALRNPAPRARSHALTLAETAGFEGAAGPVATTTVWSDAGGDAVPATVDPDRPLRLRLPAYGVVLLTARQRGPTGPAPASGGTAGPAAGTG